MKRLLAVCLAASTIFLSLGPRATGAFAAGVAANAAAAKPSVRVAPISIRTSHNGLAPLGGGLGRVSLGGTRSPVSLSPALRATGAAAAESAGRAPAAAVPAAAMAPAAGVVAAPMRLAPAAAPRLAPAASRAQRTPAARRGERVTAVAREVDAALEVAGPIARAGVESAAGLGASLQEILAGRAASARGAAALVPVAGRMGHTRHLFSIPGEPSYGFPAGKGSIEDAVRSYDGGGSGSGNGGGGESGGGREDGGGQTSRAPLAWRALSMAAAIIPTVLIAAPLLAGGSWLAGGLALAAGLGVSAMPLFGAGTPKLIRSLPGALVGAFGVYTAAVALGAGAAALGSGAFWMGALVALGGWGLIRFGSSEDKEYFDEEKVLTAFFGAIGAVVGAGLTAAPLAALAGTWAGWLPFMSFAPGWVAAAAAATGAWGWLVWAAGAALYVPPLFLLMHLPGWVGEGLESAARGFFASYEGYHRVLGSVKRDTVLRERLEKWSKAKLSLSVWNLFKVGAVWIPVWLTEGAKWVLAVAGGLVAGLAQAPLMFAWGAAHKLAGRSEGDGAFARINKFFAGWNRTIYDWAQFSKSRVYNKAVGRIIPFANAESALVSVPASAALLVAQLLWTAYTIPAFLVSAVAGVFKGFAETRKPYDPARHDPDHLRADKDDSPWEKPPVGKPAVSDMFPPGLLALGLGLIPLALFGLPLAGISVPWLAAVAAKLGLAAGPLAGSIPLLGYGYLLAGASVALMPAFPKATPKLIRQAPGALLLLLGLTTMGLVPWLSFGAMPVLAALKTNAFWMGAVTALGGLALVNLVHELSRGKESNRYYSADDPEYIGGYFGALAALTGTGIALTGLSGIVPGIATAVSYLASLLLLAQLPRWFWHGVRTIFTKAWHSVENFAEGLGFWRERDQTRFYANLKDFWRRQMKGSLWEVAFKGFFLGLFVWAPTGIVVVAEYLLSFALGAAMGALRAPANWAWGAAYRIDPDSRVSRFIAGFARALSRYGEGSRERVFLAPLKRLGILDAMSEAAPSGRPTLKAAGAFLVARVWQALWLAGVVALSGLPLAAAGLGYSVPALLSMPAVLALPVLPVLALYAGWLNARGEKKKPGEGEWRPDPDRPETKDDRLN